MIRAAGLDELVRSVDQSGVAGFGVETIELDLPPLVGA